MFYVTDTTTELYTWRLKKPDGEVMCAASFLEEIRMATKKEKKSLPVSSRAPPKRPL